jgi:transposase
MSARLWLDDDAWAVIEPLLPKNQPGARRVDDRRVIRGILHSVACLLPWRLSARVRSAHDHLRPLQVEEAERELDAAKRLSEVRAAAKKLQHAKAELGWLANEGKPKRSLLPVAVARAALPHSLRGFRRS